MNKAMKGALLSGLVLPGLGQIVLKRRYRGGLLLLVSLACLAVLVEQAVVVATGVIDKIDLLNGAIDQASLIAEVSRAAANPAGVTFRLTSWLFMLLWLGGTVDAYLLGRKIDEFAKKSKLTTAANDKSVS